jgi:hypothetical protein
LDPNTAQIGDYNEVLHDALFRADLTQELGPRTLVAG